MGDKPPLTSSHTSEIPERGGVSEARKKEVRAAYEAAIAEHGYRGVWLMRQGDHVIVLVESPDGEWVEVIREFFDSNFSHSVTSLGIKCAIDGTEEYGPGSPQMRVRPEALIPRATASTDPSPTGEPKL